MKTILFALLGTGMLGAVLWGFLGATPPASPPTMEKPDAEVIAQAINEGVDLDVLRLQSVSGMSIRSGGQISPGQYLYLCDADLVWNFSSTQVTEHASEFFSTIGLTHTVPRSSIVCWANLKPATSRRGCGCDWSALANSGSRKTLPCVNLVITHTGGWARLVICNLAKARLMIT